jgi:signal transduction histidine kinase
MPRFFRTLQFRLAAAFVLWTALLQLALLLGIPLLREPYMLEQMDRAIAVQAAGLPERLEAMGAPPAEIWGLSEEIDAEAEGTGPILVQIRSHTGEVLATSPRIADLIFPLNPNLALRPGEASFQTVFLPSGYDLGEGARRLRVATYRIAPRGHEPFYLQIGASLAAADRMHSLLTLTLAAALVAGTLGAGIAGWLVAGAVAARIKRVTGAVREVSPNRLQERVDLPEGDDEIGRMAAEVNAMLRRIAEAVQSHERFISHVSHELKTPVAALLAEAQVIKYRPTEEAYESFVLSVEDEMRRLGRMVESFLMLARFGHGRRFLADAMVPINDIALEAVEHASLLAHQHGVTLGLNLYDAGPDDPEALVRGDAELLRVVIDNLIRNAVQFSRMKDRVDVGVEVHNGQVILTVRDQGPGIPEEYLDRVFERFVQAPSVPDAGRRGTGLGLTIAKGVVDLHGGHISVRNRPEGGCEFTVRLPLAIPPARPGHAGSIAQIHIVEPVPTPR